MSRADAERVFGRTLVADALADLDPERADDATIGAFARLASEHARDDLSTFRLVVGAWLSTLAPSLARAVVRVVVGGVAAELADVERRGVRMH